MSFLLLIAAAILLAGAFVSAYFTGKAELTVSQMLVQREVAWCYFGSYGLWWLYDLQNTAYSFGYVVFKFFVFVGLGSLLIPIHNRGKRRKQTQREE